MSNKISGLLSLGLAEASLQVIRIINIYPTLSNPNRQPNSIHNKRNTREIKYEVHKFLFGSALLLVQSATNSKYR